MTRARDLADFNLDGKAVTINESSADLDFRVESDNATNALFVQGSDGKVGVNTAAPNLQMSVNFDTSAVAGFGLHDTNSGNLGGMLQFYSGSGQGTLRANIMNANNAGVHAALGTGGTVVFGGTSYTAANALDDYEEGTWTPTFTASDTSNNPTITYSHQTGKYVKVGALVHIDVYIRTTAVTGTTGGTTAHRLRMDGLPFQADSQGSASSSFSNLDGMSNGAQIQVSNGSSRCVIKELDGDVNNNDMFTNDLGTGSDDNQLFFSLTYRTDS